MFRYQAFFEPDERPRRPFALTPALDMGMLKVEDLFFDVGAEAYRLRVAGAVPPAAPRP